MAFGIASEPRVEAVGGRRYTSLFGLRDGLVCKVALRVAVFVALIVSTAEAVDSDNVVPGLLADRVVETDGAVL